MYASALLTILLASAALAVPNILPRPHAIPPAPRNRDGIAYPSAAYGLTPESTSTTALTLSTTIHTPRATVTWPATIIRATETVNQTAARTRAEIRSSLEAGTKSLTSTDSSTSTNLPEPPTLAGVYICSDINWSGICKHYLTPIGSSPSACTLLNGTASSIGPDMGFTCDFYTNSYCDTIFNDRHDVITLEYPGTADLRNLQQGDYNDDFYSYQCFESG